MASDLFGEYLAKQHVLGRAELEKALQAQHDLRVPIGQMAVAGGYMDYNDVQRVLALQKRRRGEMFGNISEGLGLLDRDKVDFLLRAQMQESKRIGELLVERRVISPDQLRRQLHSFNKQRRKMTRRRVLLVGGASAPLQILVDLADSLHLQLEHEPNPRNVVQTVHAVRPQLLVLGIDPRKDGCSVEEVLDLVGENWQAASIETVVFPAAADSVSGAGGLGGAHVLEFPYRLQDVHRVLEECLENACAQSRHFVLVIDPNPIARALICQELADAGLGMCRCDSIEQAFGMMKGMRFGLVVLGEAEDAGDLEALKSLKRLAGSPVVRCLGRLSPKPPDELSMPSFRRPFQPGEFANFVVETIQSAEANHRNVVLVAARGDAGDRLVGMLEHQGCRIERCASADALVDYVRYHKADAAVVHESLDECRGIASVAALRRRTDFYELPIVLVLDDYDPELNVRAFSAGVSDVVGNGAHPEEIRARVARHLAYKRKMDQMKREAVQLEKQAVTDPLTGLSNRRNFMSLFEREIERSRRYNRQPVSVLIIDIDDFKNFNDTYGHHHGDLVLQEVARTLRTRTRITDIVARYGGEEFALVLPETGSDGAFVVAENLRRAVEKANFFGTEYAHLVTISIGVSAYDPKDPRPIEKLILEADKAMYQAKAKGKNRTVVSEMVRED